MADDNLESRTETATSRKRDEARKKGKVARSNEVEHAAVLLGSVLILWMAGPRVMEALLDVFRRSYGHLARPEFTTTSATQLLNGVLVSILAPLAPVLAGMATVSAFAGYGQVGFQVTTDALELNLDRFNPVSGVQRLVSLRSTAQLAVAALKIAAILMVGYTTIRGDLPAVLALHHATPLVMIKAVSRMTLDLSLRVAILMALVAAADYAYQHWQYERDLRMTRQEVKEEQKLLEGNPEVEARIRRVQLALTRSRMLRNVKQADVVVRNPTHYAVALKYDPQKAPAPIVLAKGADFLAVRIVELAARYRVTTLHDAPLAQALYKTVDVGDMVPTKLYRAVARLLLHVYKLRKQTPPASGSGDGKIGD